MLCFNKVNSYKITLKQVFRNKNHKYKLLEKINNQLLSKMPEIKISWADTIKYVAESGVMKLHSI